MSLTKCNCAHIVSTTGEPVGVITLQDICKYLIIQESKHKIMYSDFINSQTATHKHAANVNAAAAMAAMISSQNNNNSSAGNSPNISPKRLRA